MPEMRWLLEDTAERYGSVPAVITPTETISYVEFARRVERGASVLRARGYRAGDRIALLMPNSANYLTWLLGVIRMGGVCCPLNSRFPTPTILELLASIDCHALISDGTSPGWEKKQDLALISSHAVDQAPRLEPADHFPKTALDAPATILFTSGSAGPPKAVLHSLGNHYYSAQGATLNLPLSVGDRWLLNLPLYHVGGLGIVFRCMLAGATVVIPDRDDPLDIALERHAITHLSVVVTQLYRLLQRSPDSSLPLRCVVLGGSPIPLKLLTRARSRGLPVFASYGSTEMASQVTTTGFDSSAEQLLTSGKLLPYRELRISEDGEILVRGKTLFLGYVEGNEIRRPLATEGWFRSGDFGSVDSEGYLTVHGRKDNRFFSGGETIYPEEIERVLCEHEDIDQAAVVPVPDEEFGERCVAFVRARNGRPPDGVLTAWLEKTLPKYEVPDAFYEWPPESDPGQLKIDRGKFRRLALQRRISG